MTVTTAPEDAMTDSDDAGPAGSDNVDGRTLRRQRNRTAVIAALLDLMREGNLAPAATDIADRAGVSHRSIFRYFDDLDDLVRTAIDQALTDSWPHSRISNFAKGSFTERTDAYVDSRLRLYAHADGPLRVASMRAYSIPSLEAEFVRLFGLARDQIRTQFAQELQQFDAPDDDDVVDTICTLVSHDSYSNHVRLIGSDVERIRRAWTTALAALLVR